MACLLRLVSPPWPTSPEPVIDFSKNRAPMQEIKPMKLNSQLFVILFSCAVDFLLGLNFVFLNLISLR